MQNRMGQYWKRINATQFIVFKLEFFYFVDWKLILTRCFVTKTIYSGKIKDCNPLRADIGKPEWLCLVCQDGEIFIHGKRKLRQKEVRLIQLYYKHRAQLLPETLRLAVFLMVQLVFFISLLLFYFPSPHSHAPQRSYHLLKQLKSLSFFFLQEYMKTSALESYKLGTKTKFRSFSACSFLKDFIVGHLKYLSELLGILS